ncbi:unnamed protein product [Pseudo-nitzschia multistriata]|uniref:BTB domain-containing protein n=1 Tax=Pseudo-nitzschia multistriata TaxID=183589 RepID=A0A448YVW2_9STRA|nr:unnamed protein product [Pseudo-nitzschia multistriata]
MDRHPSLGTPRRLRQRQGKARQGKARHVASRHDTAVPGRERATAPAFRGPSPPCGTGDRFRSRDAVPHGSCRGGSEPAPASAAAPKATPCRGVPGNCNAPPLPRSSRGRATRRPTRPASRFRNGTPFRGNSGSAAVEPVSVLRNPSTLAGTKFRRETTADWCIRRCGFVGSVRLQHSFSLSLRERHLASSGVAADSIRYRSAHHDTHTCLQNSLCLSLSRSRSLTHRASRELAVSVFPITACAAAFRMRKQELTSLEGQDPDENKSNDDEGSYVASDNISFEDPTPQAEERTLSWRNDPAYNFSDWKLRVVVRKNRAGDSAADSSLPAHETTYNVHRNILAVGERRSQYFANLLHYGIDDGGGSSVVELAPRAAACFPDLLDFVYSSEAFCVTTRNAIALLFLARAFQVPSLEARAEAFVEKDLRLVTFGCYLADALYFSEEAVALRAMDACEREVLSLLNGRGGAERAKRPRGLCKLLGVPLLASVLEAEHRARTVWSVLTEERPGLGAKQALLGVLFRRKEPEGGDS